MRAVPSATPKRSWYWYRNEYTQVAPPVWPVEGIPARLKLEATKTENVLTDGTDDVLLTVSVLDEAGKLLNNSPSVYLKLISGPGEFPTGSSILFEKDSDIRMIDGQAAIAFHSYYAGKSVIEATSPGLQSVRIEINFAGRCAYESGVTPTVKERPYIRFAQPISGSPFASVTSPLMMRPVWTTIKLSSTESFA